MGPVRRPAPNGWRRDELAIRERFQLTRVIARRNDLRSFRQSNPQGKCGDCFASLRLRPSVATFGRLAMTQTKRPV
jgi:hypothetical protein